MQKIWFVLILLLLPALACNLPGGTKPAAPQGPALQAEDSSAVDGEPQSPFGEQALELPPTPLPSPTPRPDRPVSLRRGLASLNSYLLVINTYISGPSAADFTESRMEIRSDAAAGAQVIHIQPASGEMDPEEAAEAETWNYQIGTEICSLADGEYEFSSLTPAEKEMLNLNSTVIDFIPLVEDPQYVGQEAVNGVVSDHFSFRISGLGSKSGAEVVANQGEYWMAVDGEYLVRYTLVVELRPDPETAFRQEYRIELSEVNQLQAITFPPGCLAARDNAE